MFELLYLAATGAILRRFMGGGIVPEKKYKLAMLRRVGTPIAVGLALFLVWHSPWVLLAIPLGFAFKEWVGTGDMFAVLHGGFDGKIEYSPFNRWIYKLAAAVSGWQPIEHPFEPELPPESVAKHNATWGFWFCTFRGSYKLATSIALAVVAWNPIVALWGFLGLLDGVIYYTAGRIAFRTGWSSVSMAELTSGFIYGLILWGCLPS